MEGKNDEKGWEVGGFFFPSLYFFFVNIKGLLGFEVKFTASCDVRVKKLLANSKCLVGVEGVAGERRQLKECVQRACMCAFKRRKY